MNLKEFKMEIKMSTKPKKPVMPDFENIQVSTKTVIAKTNARYDIQKLFESLPVTEYTVVKKKRGRKKKERKRRVSIQLRARFEGRDASFRCG